MKKGLLLFFALGIFCSAHGQAKDYCQDLLGTSTNTLGRGHLPASTNTLGRTTPTAPTNLENSIVHADQPVVSDLDLSADFLVSELNRIGQFFSHLPVPESNADRVPRIEYFHPTEIKDLFQSLTQTYFKCRAQLRSDNSPLAAARYVGALGSLLYYYSAFQPLPDHQYKIRMSHTEGRTLVVDLEEESYDHIHDLRKDSLLTHQLILWFHWQDLKKLSQGDREDYFILRGLRSPNVFRLSGFLNYKQELRAVIQHYAQEFSRRPRLVVRTSIETIEGLNDMILADQWPLILKLKMSSFDGFSNRTPYDAFIHDLNDHYMMFKPLELSEAEARLLRTWSHQFAGARRRLAHLILYEILHERVMGHEPLIREIRDQIKMTDEDLTWLKKSILSDLSRPFGVARYISNQEVLEEWNNLFPR